MIAPIPLSPFVLAIQALYKMGEAVNNFIDDHIDELKKSDNQVVSSTGRVLEAAKIGFGIGFTSSTALIAIGQLLLGNPLDAIIVVTTAPFSPIAMTCAAIGAIYYGWNALSDKEKDAALARLTDGLSMGIELIKALIEFVLRKTKELMESKHLEEFKAFIKAQAAQFHKSLHDVTRSAVDWTNDTIDDAIDSVKLTTVKAIELVDMAADTVREKLGNIGKNKAATVANDEAPLNPKYSDMPPQ